MEYTQHVLDRSTGELVSLSAGNWITITEMGELKGVLPRRIRTILREMDFLYVDGGRAHNRHRLCLWVLREGYGKHIPARTPAICYPFDVISPEGQAWIETKWSDAVEAVEAKAHRPEVIQAHEALTEFKGRRLGELNVQGQVLWLRHHFPDLLDTEIAHILDVTQQMVSRYVSLQREQLRSAELRKMAVLKDIENVRLSVYQEDAA